MTDGAQRADDGRRPRLLLIAGSMRHGSTNVAALRAARDAARPRAEVDLFTGLHSLPLFNPDHDFDPLPSSVPNTTGRGRRGFCPEGSPRLTRRQSVRDGLIFNAESHT